MEKLTLKVISIFHYDKQKAYFIIFFLNLFVLYFFITPSFLNLIKISKYDNERSQFIEAQILARLLNKESQKIASNEDILKKVKFLLLSNK
jgi:putative lipase involved disintegration of autophagic bodies